MTNVINSKFKKNRIELWYCWRRATAPRNSGKKRRPSKELLNIKKNIISNQKTWKRLSFDVWNFNKNYMKNRMATWRLMQRWHGDYVQIWVKGMIEWDIYTCTMNETLIDTRGVIRSKCTYESNEEMRHERRGEETRKSNNPPTSKL